MYSNPLVFLPVVEPLRGLPVAILVVVLTIWPRGVCSADERKPFEGAECFEELNQRVVDKLNASEFTGIQGLVVPKVMFRPPLGTALGPGREYEVIRGRTPELAAKFCDVLRHTGQMPLKDAEIKRENDQ